MHQVCFTHSLLLTSPHYTWHGGVFKTLNIKKLSAIERKAFFQYKY